MPSGPLFEKWELAALACQSWPSVGCKIDLNDQLVQGSFDAVSSTSQALLPSVTQLLARCNVQQYTANGHVVGTIVFLQPLSGFRLLFVQHAYTSRGKLVSSSMKRKAGEDSQPQAPRSRTPPNPAGIDYRKNPELYKVARGEQGVLTVEPYKSEILPHWRFRQAFLTCRAIDGDYLVVA